MIDLLTEQEAGRIIGVLTQTHACEPFIKKKGLESLTSMLNEFSWSMFYTG